MQELRKLNEYATIDASEPLVMDYCWKGSKDGKVNINVFNHTGEFGIGTPAVDSTVNTIGYVGKPPEAPVGKKYDAGKPMYALVPANALEEVVAVLTAGAVKYNEPLSEENWRKVDSPFFRYYSAAMRHMEADRKGELIDVDKVNPDGSISKGTDCYHLACAVASLMFMLQLRMEAADKAKL